MKLFLLQPGYVMSKNDGDRHYVGAGELARLYDVEVDECYEMNDVGRVHGISQFVQDALYVLCPRYDGDYKITAYERLKQTIYMTEVLAEEERRQQEAKWKGIPVKDPAGNIVGRVIEAKLTYGPDSAIITAEVEPSFARYLTSSMKGEFSVGD